MEDFNPYEILGVPSDATKATIFAAYKRKAKETHPDKKGGSEKLFQTISKAYRILKDDAARLHYDNTGTINDATDTLEAQAMQTVIDFFNRLAQETIDTPNDPLKQDLISLGKKFMGIQITNIKNKKHNLKRAMEVLIKMESKLKIKKGNGLIKRGLLNQIRQMKVDQQGYEMGIKIHNRACELFDEYEFEAELMLRYYPPQTTIWRNW